MVIGILIPIDLKKEFYSVLYTFHGDSTLQAERESISFILYDGISYLGIECFSCKSVSEYLLTYFIYFSFI